METIAIALFIGVFAFWYIGSKISLRAFRILFITSGFLILYVALTYVATLTNSYTVPASPSVPSFTQANIRGLTTLMLTAANASGIIALFYIAIELALYLYQLFMLMKEHNISFRKAFMKQMLGSEEE